MKARRIPISLAMGLELVVLLRQCPVDANCCQPGTEAGGFVVVARRERETG